MNDNLKIGLTGVSTLQHMAAPLKSAFAVEKWDAEMVLGDFGQVIRDLMAPDSVMRQTNLDACVVILDEQGLFQMDWRLPAEQQNKMLSEKVDMLIDALSTYAEYASCPLLVNTLISPLAPRHGLLEQVSPSATGTHVLNLNRKMGELALKKTNVILLDTPTAFSALPLEECFSQKMWYYGKIPFSSQAFKALAGAVVDAMVLLKQGPKKVLALDMDNTLWGGVIGEDGLEGIRCDDEFPGCAFKDFQRECLRLKSQGFLLVVLSKNEEDAFQVFDKHQGMLLQKDDFTATKINWKPKPDNIRELAEILNLGLNSFIFLDDSPHERQAMRELCPEVMVPELPEDPALRPLFLRGLRETWVTRLTSEDANRTELYQNQVQRDALQKESKSFDDYLNGLQQKLVMAPLNEVNLGRIAQLHMRTNQFNLTTERLDESALSAMMNNEKALVLCGRAEDRFGDHGIIITSVCQIEDRVAELRTLLMSCRVIGRNVEVAFLDQIVKALQNKGVEKVKGRFIASRKNAQVKDFYQRCGFKKVSESDSGSEWQLDVEEWNLPTESVFPEMTWKS